MIAHIQNHTFESNSGDGMMALHVLGQNEIVNQDEKASLFSLIKMLLFHLVKTFGSVLAVYEEIEHKIHE